jgi:putative transcriptional regulator
MSQSWVKILRNDEFPTMTGQAPDEMPTWLNGQLLIAMPGMRDPRFGRTVLYICTHSSEGAMGLVINRAFGEIRFADLMTQLGIEGSSDQDRPVHFGGPVDSSRGFVLHSADFRADQTLVIDDNVALTATKDILQAIVEGHGPGKAIFALGYAKWFAGQLDSEIQANEWLTAPADNAIIFDKALDTKWERAIAQLGFDPAMLSGSAGHA